MAGRTVTLDANEAVAEIAHRTNEVIAIYPITPASPMGEFADQWSGEGRRNIWGAVPRVIQLQSEAGAAGAVHGALQAGSLTTTFTASQGLMLMLPNMYKIAGELTPTVFHIAARSLAAQGLSIFCDHGDVMAARGTGFALLCSSSVQEAPDMALIAQAATLASRVPFLHFFDGFRTSHEVNRIQMPGEDDVRAMIDDAAVAAHRARALSPDHPVLRGTSQNPDVYFQGRESVNPFYLACPAIVADAMDRFAGLTGRRYGLFDYVGAPDAETVLVMMGSGCGAAEETVEHLNARGAKVGLLKVRLYRPFAADAFLSALPAGVRTLAVLDRCKEPGCLGEPLYLDVLAAVAESDRAGRVRVVGGRYGLGSKEFTPGMVKAVFDAAAAAKPRNHFTVGIADDVTHTSLDYDPDLDVEDPSVVRCVFFGLGSDGTVSANKNSIKIIGEDTDNHAQGYFVYDSKKSGSVTVSHLRFGPRPIRSTYKIRRARFVACHQFPLLERLDVLSVAEPGGVFLLNSPHGRDEVWGRLPRPVQRGILAKRLRFFVIDGYKVARQTGMGGRFNTILQTAFFAVSGVLPREAAIAAIKKSIEKAYGKRGRAVVESNFAAVDAALAELHEVRIPAGAAADSPTDRRPPVSADAPEFVRKVTSLILAGQGDDLPVSAMPADGTWPTATARYEKRDIAAEIPVWDPATCIQCGKCVLVCPHAVIRGQLAEPAAFAGAPPGFQTAPARWREFPGKLFTLQVSAHDCTGCSLCVEVCPAKNKSETRLKAVNMRPADEVRAKTAADWEFFRTLPAPDRTALNADHVRDVQLMEPLFEFSGACGGCGETPYLKLLTQLVGDRLVVANATGCSSIYGGNLPTTPWAVGRDGRGPAWNNSLFEDNAEFGLGMRTAVDQQTELALQLLDGLSGAVGTELAAAIRDADQSDDAGVAAQRARVAQLKAKLSAAGTPEARRLLAVADALVRRSVWIVGGDGWAYDIGFGGLDHVLATGANVKMLVLDTEVYSNTGGQASKATPRGAVAKFAAGGKAAPKKDLALMAMTYGNTYVARVAMGAADMHTLKAFREAEAFPGPAIIIAYSHCIAHGYDLVHGLDQQKAAVQSGQWPLLRFDPRRTAEGRNPLELDSGRPTLPLEKYLYNETRYTMLVQSRPETAKRLLEEARRDVAARRKLYEHLAAMPVAEPLAAEGKK